MPLDKDIATASYMNEVGEQAILPETDQYMWLDYRFKTDQPDKSSLHQ